MVNFFKKTIVTFFEKLISLNALQTVATPTFPLLPLTVATCIKYVIAQSEKSEDALEDDLVVGSVLACLDGRWPTRYQANHHQVAFESMTQHAQTHLQLRLIGAGYIAAGFMIQIAQAENLGKLSDLRAFGSFLILTLDICKIILFSFVFYFHLYSHFQCVFRFTMT